MHQLHGTPTLFACWALCGRMLLFRVVPLVLPQSYNTRSWLPVLIMLDSVGTGKACLGLCWIAQLVDTSMLFGSPKSSNSLDDSLSNLWIVGLNPFKVH